MAAENPEFVKESTSIISASGEASDLTAHSDHTSDSSGEDTDCEFPESPRKRRRTSPTLVSDDEPLPNVPRSAPLSRVKPSSVVQQAASQQRTISGAILAPTDPQTTFAALNVKPWLVGSLGAMAIKRPTGIQKGCIPEILRGRDCIGGSRTGSGKTVAFAVPILQKWAEDPFGIFALVLTPTRYGFPRDPEAGC